MRAPYSVQSVISLERHLPARTTVATTITYSRGEHLLLSRDISAPLPGSGIRPFDEGKIFQHESAGIMRQVSWNTNVASHVRHGFALFAMYGYGIARDNTDGGFPADQYNLTADYGRSYFDMRHHFEAGGSIVTIRGVRFSPIFDGHSGLPFNITSGCDLTGDGLYTDRPAFAADPSIPGVVRTSYGLLDPTTTAGAKLVPRNYGNAASLLNQSMRVSKTFAFGGGKSRKSAAAGVGVDGSFQSVFGDAPAEKRYGVTISASARNLLNCVNADRPIGVLTSPSNCKCGSAFSTNAMTKLDEQTHLPFIFNDFC